MAQLSSGDYCTLLLGGQLDEWRIAGTTLINVNNPTRQLEICASIQGSDALIQTGGLMTLKYPRPDVDGIEKVALDKYEAEHGELEQGNLTIDSGPRTIVITDKARGIEKFYAYSSSETVQEITREQAEERKEADNRRKNPKGPFGPGGPFGDNGGPFRS